MKEVLHLTWREVYDRLASAPPGKLWGVPRGGQVIAGLTGRAVDSLEEADAVVDDIVDTGTTRDRYLATGKRFWALVDRTARAEPDAWFVFPWEHRDPATDIKDHVLRVLEFAGARTDLAGQIVDILAQIAKKP